MARGFPKILDLLCVFLLYWTMPSIQAEKHSLYYIYTGLSKPVDRPGIYEFTAMGLLDDTQIDYYNSEEKRKIPKQHWMKEKLSENYWEEGTKSRKKKEWWFKVSVQTLMDRMRHDTSDLHVLQWRVGCEVEQQGDEVKFLKGIYEFSYDGEYFLSFDDKEARWVAPVDAALPTKRKWDIKPTLNQNTKDYLENKCVEWLNRLREYGDEELRKTSRPDVHVFANNSISDKTKLNLTCMATGFYPKDVAMIIRNDNISLRQDEDEIKSTGIRSNYDGSYQLRKSVVIKKEERNKYYCYVSHRTLSEPINIKWDGRCKNCLTDLIYPEAVIGGVIAGVITVAVIAVVLCILYKKKIIVCCGQEDKYKL